ncbi:MAG: hypothetical protein EA397_01390 [Deltaproteobacteria bacterium]|nr:MAG: hypothetical protein EA397_01390 [Deltaproteobacteria bacterium]
MLGLLLLIGLSIYFIAAFKYKAHQTMPGWLVIGAWSMFTAKDARHVEVEAKALAGGEWHSLDLPKIFPYRWESGHRYHRRHVRRSKKNLGILAQAACTRSGLDPERIRFTELQWTRTLGSFVQPQDDLERIPLGTFRCERPR